MPRRRTLLPRPRLVRLAAFAALATMAFVLARAGAAGPSAVDYRLKAQLVTEIDSNAERKEGAERSVDGATRLLARGSLTWRIAREHVLQTRLDLGAKVFFRLRDEDLFVTSGSLLYGWSPRPWLTLSVDGGLKDRHERIGETDYLQSFGGGALRFTLSRYFDLRLRAGYQRFEFRPDDFSFGYRGDDYSLELAAFPARRMRLSASYSFSRRDYRAPLFVADDGLAKSYVSQGILTVFPCAPPPIGTGAPSRNERSMARQTSIVANTSSSPISALPVPRIALMKPGIRSPFSIPG